MAELSENVDFAHHIVDGVTVQTLGLVHVLEGVVASVVTLLDDADLAEGALADGAHDGEVLQGDGARLVVVAGRAQAHN